eukprot:687423-Alexandrium_andersonii.AAC.1
MTHWECMRMPRGRRLSEAGARIAAPCYAAATQRFPSRVAGILFRRTGQKQARCGSYASYAMGPR